VNEHPDPRPVDWATATRTRLGEWTSGDLAVVSALPDGALVAAVDGVGHGREAARAARTAGEILWEGARDDPVVLVRRCHEALKGTRGAAMSLAILSATESTIAWLGVGNVEGMVVGGDRPAPGVRASLPLLSGLPGHELPELERATLDVHPGDVLILATDGVEPGFADSLDLSGRPQAIAERILADHWKATDDALAVVVRYLGLRP
jgi:phosphoserine phosphatase RsbX